jgi:hypothetical protein
MLMVAGLALAGCVPSLNPLYTEKDLVYDEALLGTWAESEDAKDRWTFEPLRDKVYRVTFTEDDEAGEFEVHLLELGGERYLDFQPQAEGMESMRKNGFYKLHWVPAHTFARIGVKEGTMRMAFMNPEWIDKHLEGSPESLSHVRRGEDGLVLTATTTALQEFVREHAQEMFGDEMELKRATTVRSGE